ncbi:hypothetical protein A2U01_0028556, partial [Trifolium medium]|nr:hypothetical protein [Trifolium medium]
MSFTMILPYLASRNSIPWTYHSSQPIPSSNHSPDISSQPNHSTVVFHDSDDDHTSHTPPISSDTEFLETQVTIPTTANQPSPATEPTHHSTSPPSLPSPHTPSLRRSTRPSIKPSHLSDYVCNLSTGSSIPTSS